MPGDGIQIILMDMRSKLLSPNTVSGCFSIEGLSTQPKYPTQRGFLQHMKVRKAVIPAAGLGTRFLPATKAMPKEMLPIVDTPTIQYIIQEAIDSGIEEILIITGKSKRAIEDHFDKNVELELELEKKANEELLKVVRDITDLVDIHYIRQKEAKGLGHAIYCAKTFVGNEPFAVMLGDDVVYNAEKRVWHHLTRQLSFRGGTLNGSSYRALREPLS